MSISTPIGLPRPKSGAMMRIGRLSDPCSTSTCFPRSARVSGVFSVSGIGSTEVMRKRVEVKPWVVAAEVLLTTCSISSLVS